MAKIAFSVHYGEPAFFCPGCNRQHIVHVSKPNEWAAIWTWNKSLDKPTFTPSLHVNSSDPESCCHSFVRNGFIQFLPDCHHELAGKTVEIPEWD